MLFCAALLPRQVRAWPLLVNRLLHEHLVEMLGECLDRAGEVDRRGRDLQLGVVLQSRGVEAALDINLSDEKHSFLP